MSLRDIVSGAGCEQTANPLSNFLQSFTSNTFAQNDASIHDLHHLIDPSKEKEELDVSTELGNIMNRLDHRETEFDPKMAQMMMMQQAGIESMEEFWDGQDPFMSEDSFFDSYVPFREPPPQEYIFTRENPFLNSPAPFEEGVELYRSGRLQEAILAFESHLQRNLTPETSDVWRWLGTAHAENDEDKTAILCLRNSVQADPENIEALLDIGVSYTNELNQQRALTYLRNWMKQHPEYQSLVGEEQLDQKTLPWERADHVIEIFKKAEQIVPDDPDIYAVQGVLFNLTRQYDLAEEAFRKALQFDPKNHSLWNKLGATQANSPKASGSKDAVKAYRKAIELKPNYVRAWVNMGISYANQGMYDISAKYYLRALSLNDKAEHIWSYLKVALACMKREDLSELVTLRDVNRFRNDFEF